MIHRSPGLRRLVTVPVLLLSFLLSWVASPALAVVALVVDAVRWAARRTPWMAIRLVAFLLAYLTAETVGVIALFATWVGTGFGHARARLHDATFAIQRAWAGSLLWTVRRVFSLTVRAEGLDAVAPAPFLLLGRHASIVDNLLPSHFISRPHRIHIRYVMKDELLVDPSIDIAGNRLGNLFVRRGSRERDRELGAIRTMAAGTPRGEGILIYPEGTRFSEAKRRAALRRLSAHDSRLHDLASRLRTVLPPRPAGTLALLEGRMSDVVVMAHRGLEGFARVADIWRGGMVRTLVQVRFWRIPADEIPEGRSARTEWLFSIWQELDDWVAGAEPAGDPTPA